jgi:hypothetical protein
MRRQLSIVLIIVSLIISAGLVTYFYKYHGPASNKSEDWSNFAHYMDLYISFASLILIGFISILTHEINERSTEIARRSLESTARFYRNQMTPILDLSVERSSVDYFPTYQDSWWIMNCSIATARNISLKFWMGSRESFCITLYSMAEKIKLELPWLKYASKIKLYYSDANSESYYVFEMENIRGTITELNESQFRAIREERYVNVADVMLDFNGKFLKVKGRPLTEPEYTDFFEAYRKV